MYQLCLKSLVMTAVLLFFVLPSHADTDLPANELVLSWAPDLPGITLQDSMNDEKTSCDLTAKVTLDGEPVASASIEWQIFSIPPTAPTYVEVVPTENTNNQGEAQCTLTKQPGPENTVKVRVVVLDDGT